MHPRWLALLKSARAAGCNQQQMSDDVPAEDSLVINTPRSLTLQSLCCVRYAAVRAADQPSCFLGCNSNILVGAGLLRLLELLGSCKSFAAIPLRRQLVHACNQMLLPGTRLWYNFVN
jgi:hypothetical protein